MINLENLISRRCILSISKRQSYHRRTVVPWPALNVSFSWLWGLQGSKEWTSDLATLTSFTKIFCSMFFKICSINRYLISENYGDKFFFFFCYWIIAMCGQMIFIRVLKLPSEERIVSSTIYRIKMQPILWEEVSANFITE